jgi:cytochrome P450
MYFLEATSISSLISKRIEFYFILFPPQNDLLTWFIDEAGAGRPERRTPRNLTRKLCFMNLGATHTVATAFLQALYNLATAPEYVEALREEVAAVVGAEGWTKGAMTRMVLLDSFLKETMRVSPGSASECRFWVGC